MFIVALFTLGKTCKQPKSPMTGGWIKKMGYVYMYIYIYIQLVYSKVLGFCFPHDSFAEYQTSATVFYPDE